MASKYSHTDVLCRANLQKLQGLIHFRERNYVRSLQYFESANATFATLSVGRRQSIGIALCMSAEGYLQFNYAVYFVKPKQDESMLFAKAAERFEQALLIYKNMVHIAGQAFCTKQLGTIRKKMGMQSDHLFKEQRQLARQKVIQIQEGKWVQRIDGDYLSLFIETVGEEPKGGQHAAKQQVKKANEIRPETWIPQLPPQPSQALKQGRVAQSKVQNGKRYGS